ncbi:MAG: DUF2752 domain-containing protein [Phycisphaerae bacterium]|nr:DUF2752 domain-containing protein [Phycisphaerae bacterium]
MTEHAKARSDRSAGLHPGGRLLSLTVGLGCVAVLLIATGLHPDGRGHGTHEQLGLGPCAWPLAFGKPCPTCGMTTSFSLAVRGRVVDAARAQPFGVVLAYATACLAWIGLHGAATGSAVWSLCAGVLRPGVMWVIGGVWLISWVYKWLTWT